MAAIGRASMHSRPICALPSPASAVTAVAMNLTIVGIAARGGSGAALPAAGFEREEVVERARDR